MNFTQSNYKNIYATLSVNSSVSEKAKGYSFAHSTTSDIASKNTNSSSLIQSYFFSMKNSGLLHSNPTFSHTSTKVTIHVFYYMPWSKESVNLSIHSMSVLSNSLASLYNKEVSLVMTRIHYPYLNSSIFAKYLAHNAPSNTFVHFQNSILTYPSRNASSLPAYVSGIKIQVSGRLVTESVKPRMTTNTCLFGSFSSAPMVDYAKHTTKNSLGAFTIKVWIAQRTPKVN
jgi:hypothetical protein